LFTACCLILALGVFCPLAALSVFKSKTSPKSEVVNKSAKTVAVSVSRGTQPANHTQSSEKKATSVQTGVASWYGGSFIGGKTANGERYQADDRTAAHRNLPFGTYVRVINLANHRSAVVRINNRGPFVKGRIIDVSKQAAIDLAMVNSGTARVRLEVIPKAQLHSQSGQSENQAAL
jgi:rare lipoprotein A